MNANRDEALRAKNKAEELMQKSDFRAACRLATKAGKMDDSLRSEINQMTKICEVHLAAEIKIEVDLDWYGILQVKPSADDGTMKKEYKKLALILHPDKNRFPGAEEAFKLVGEAHCILTDHFKRSLHDHRRWRSPPAMPAWAMPSWTAEANPFQTPTPSHQKWRTNASHQNEPPPASHQKWGTNASHQNEPPPASHQKQTPTASHQKQTPNASAYTRKRKRTVYLSSSDSDSSRVPEVVNLSDDNLNEKKKQEEDAPDVKEEKKKQEEDAPDVKEEKKKQEEDVDEGREEKQTEDVSANRMFYGAPDFNDFDVLREKMCFQADQIWALYDEEDGMPRYYALISEVTHVDFKLRFAWLDVDEENDDGSPYFLPVSVGRFEVGSKAETNKVSFFSHLVCSISGRLTRGRKFTVFPKKGETWALFKNWDSASPSKYEYDYVEILSDHAEGNKVSVGFLSKVEGYTSVFRPMPKDSSCEIQPQEYFRFSHCVPSFRLTGTEDKCVASGWYELDPAALPA